MITLHRGQADATAYHPGNGATKGSKLSAHGQVAKLWQLFMDSYLKNGGKPYPVEQFPAKAGTGDDHDRWRSVADADRRRTPGNSPGCPPGNCPTGGRGGGGTGRRTGGGGPTTPPPRAGSDGEHVEHRPAGKVRLSLGQPRPGRRQHRLG